MALSVGTPSTCNPIKLFQHQHDQLRPSSSSCAPYRARANFSFCSMRRHLFDPNKVKMQIEVAMENSNQAIPQSVKSFPWKKAATMLLGRVLLSVSRMAIPLFIYMFIVDILNAFYLDQVLAIPLGLFVGCLTTDFFKELLQVKFLGSEEECHWFITGLMVSIKIIAIAIASRPPMFIQHVANGGVMQALWLRKRSMEEANMEQESDSTSSLERPFLWAKRVLSWYIFSYTSYTITADVAHCFYANQRMIVPLGLFIGFFMVDCLRFLVGYFKTDLLTKISQQLGLISEVNFLWGTLGIMAFIKLVISPFQPPMFLIQVANGWLMRTFWHLTVILVKNRDCGQDKSPTSGSELEA